MLTLTTPELPVEQWTPSFSKAQAFPNDTVAVLSQSSTLTTYVSGQSVREGPMLMRGQGRLTRLDGSIQLGDRHWLGWSGDQVMATHDAGQNWFRQSNTSGRSIHTLVLLENGILLAELDGGRLLRSKDDGWTWAPAEGWEAHDFTVATGRNPGTEHPLACLLSTSDAMLQLEFESRGCFGGSASTLELRVRTEGAHLKGSREEYPEPLRVDQRLGRTEGEQFLRKLVDAATRAEHGMRCQSTTAAEVRLSWSCGSSLFKTTHRAKLTGSLCSPPRQRAEGAPEPYDRVDGVFDAAWDVLEEAVSRPRTDAPGAHPGVTR
ncbi:beta propeller repeat protein [Corallococcus sp. M7]